MDGSGAAERLHSNRSFPLACFMVGLLVKVGATPGLNEITVSSMTHTVSDNDDTNNQQSKHQHHFSSNWMVTYMATYMY